MSIVDDVCTELEAQGDAALESLRGALARIRTGRANVSILDSIRVEYYGSKSPLNQVATLSVPDARLITIKPFDKNLLSEIEKVLRATSDLGLSPQNDGEKILLPIPPLTEDRHRFVAFQPLPDLVLGSDHFALHGQRKAKKKSLMTKNNT